MADLQIRSVDVVIVGTQNDQNSLLAELIGRHTGYRCIFSPIRASGRVWMPAGGLALVDVASMPKQEVVGILKQISGANPNIPIALFNAAGDEGWDGIVSWPRLNGIFIVGNPQDEILQGIEALIGGGHWLPTALLLAHLERTRVRRHDPTPHVRLLTRKEREILRHIATGSTNGDIARRQNISLHTVKTHVYNVFRKIGASSRAQAAAWALRHMGFPEQWDG